MKKKIIITSILLLIVFFVMYYVTKPGKTTTLLKNYKDYKDITVSNITNITVNRYTEGGLDSNIITDKEKVMSLYKKITNIKLGEETDMACEDNTTIYVINFKDGSSKTVTIECDWVIIGEKRYMIVK